MWALINTEQLIDHFHIALFPALEWTHCTLVTCGVEWVTVAFHCEYWYPPKWCAYKVTALMVVTWLVPHETADVLAYSVCAPYNHAPVFSVTSFKATDVGRMSSFTVTCHLYFWQNDQIFYFLLCQHRGGTDTNTSQHKRLTLEENILEGSDNSSNCMKQRAGMVSLHKQCKCPHKPHQNSLAGQNGSHWVTPVRVRWRNKQIQRSLGVWGKAAQNTPPR